MNDELNKQIDERIRVFMKGSGFSARKLTDTPTDSNMVTPRGYVNMNGPTTSRPTGSILGQQFFDTDLGFPVYWNGTTFVDATGTPA